MTVENLVYLLELVRSDATVVISEDIPWTRSVYTDIRVILDPENNELIIVFKG